MAINAAKISEVFEEDDVDKVAETLVEELTASLDLIAPLRPIHIKERSSPLYLRKETREIMVARDAAAAKKDWSLYRRMRNLASRRVRQDRVSSNLDLLGRLGKDPKMVWRLADSLTGRGRNGTLPTRLKQDGQLVGGDDKLADIMNCHYIAKIAKIREGIEQERRQRPSSSSPSSSPSTLPPASSSSFTLRAPTPWEVQKTIGRLRNTPAVGEDGIPTKVIKDLSQVLAAPLAHLAARSFATGRVPAVFKTANVVPVYKKGKDPSQPSSFRPVAILCALSKVLESLVLAQLSPFLVQRMPNEQWGFRPGRSTAGALAAAQGSWMRARVQGETVAIAAFDFSSAFDTLGVEELVLKLRSLNIGEKAVHWFRDYLSNRQQRVKYGTARSSLRDVVFGVPQGSLLGPVLFTTLIADLPSTVSGCSNNVGVTLYADDTCIWSAHKNPAVAKKELEQASSRLLSYALENSLALNPAKTQLLWSNNPSPIIVGNTLVRPQDELLLLGVKFDGKLTIKPHLQSLVGTARSLLSMTRRLLLHLPRGQQVQDIVRALVVGRLCYGSILVPPRLSEDDPCCQLLQSVQTTVNDIARQLMGVSRSDRIPVEQLLDATDMPSLNRAVIKTIQCEAWKCLRSCDGPGGGLNPLGMILSHSPVSSSALNVVTRSAKAGALPPPLRIRADTFVWFATKLYNDNVPLRSAQSYVAAQRAAESLSRAAPI